MNPDDPLSNSNEELTPESSQPPPQEPPQKNKEEEEMPPLSAGLAKRLAEAADGLRDDLYHYLISRLTPPYGLACDGHVDKQSAYSQAKEKMNQLNAGLPEKEYYLFGPYQTKCDPGFLPKHDQVEIRFMDKNKTLVHEPILIEQEIDAVVFSLSAFDKFFLPYYTRLYGAEQALEFRRLAIIDLLAKKPSPHGHCTACSNYIQ